MRAPRQNASSEPQAVTPWREALNREAESPVEARIAAVFAQVSPPPPWGPAAAARVLARLTAGPSTVSQGAPRRGLLDRGFGFVRLAAGSTLGLALLLLSGAVIAAGGAGAWWTLSRSPSAATARQPAPAISPRSHGRARATPSRRPPSPQEAVPTPSPSLPSPPPEAPALPAVSPSAAVSLPSSPLPEPRPRHEPPRAVSLGGARAVGSSAAVAGGAREPAPPGALGQETALLRKALFDLRQRRDGAAALATLDQYLALFPRGTLGEEARRGRVDALLVLGRDAEALQALDELDLAPVGRGLELRLIRGELRATEGCVGATADFDAVLAHGPAPALAERALWGRALCHEKLGRHDLAVADATAYLARFPQGRFATDVRRLGPSRAAP